MDSTTLNTIVVATTGSVVSYVVSYTGKKIVSTYKNINRFIEHNEMMAEVIDEHSDLLTQNNHKQFRSVSKRRRATDILITESNS